MIAVRFLLDHAIQVVAVDFDTGGFFDGGGFGLMGSLLEHGSEAEEFAGPGLLQEALPAGLRR